MPYVVKNTALDPSKIELHRVATGFLYEPSIGGVRLMSNSSMEITDEQYERLKTTLSSWEKKGMVEVTKKETGEGTAEGSEKMKVGRKETTEPRAGASETPKGLPVDDVDDVTHDVTRSQRPYIAEQLAGEQQAAEQLSADLRSTQQQLAAEQREDGAKKGPKKKLF